MGLSRKFPLARVRKDMASSTDATTCTIRLCLIPPLFAFCVSARAAQLEAIQADLFSLQITRAETQSSNAYQMDATIGKNRLNGFVFEKRSHPPSLSRLKWGTLWTTSLGWIYSNDNFRHSLSPRLRVESKGSRFEFNPVKHTASITWRRELE
jgi:hypothetical protein